MGERFRTRLAGLARPDEQPAEELNDAEAQSALGRLSAYDPPSRPERRRPSSAHPALHNRAGLWRR
jgi:hypothetical protein